MLELWWYPLLFVTGLVAGLVDAIAGGGGLLTIPVLLSTGLAPAEVLGTNKLQASFGSGTATWHYARGGVVDFRACRLGVACTLVGAALGAWAVTRLPREVLAALIPFLLAAILVYMLVHPRIGGEPHAARLPAPVFFTAAGLGLGFYDGFFGPGTGTFLIVGFVSLCGRSLLDASADAKIVNFASNLAAVAIFASRGTILWDVALPMAIGQLFGGILGTRLALKGGARIVRAMVLVVSTALIAKLIVDLVTG